MDSTLCTSCPSWFKLFETRGYVADKCFLFQGTAIESMIQIAGGQSRRDKVGVEATIGGAFVAMREERVSAALRAAFKFFLEPRRTRSAQS